MSLPRFFLDSQVLAHESEEVFALRLTADDARHFLVLRLRKGEHIAVIDAAADYFECEIVATDGDLPLVRISQRVAGCAPCASVILVQGLAKGEKFDEVVRHATELGVSGFVPLACERSVVKLDGAKTAKRIARWGAIAKSAAMQSGQLAIPEIHVPCTARDAAALLADATAVLICWEEALSESTIDRALQGILAKCSCSPQEACVAVVVGPEGGLSREEVETFLTLDRACAVTLGSSILRTETAGVVAPALVLYELNRLARSK